MELILRLFQIHIPSWLRISFGCLLIGIAFTMSFQRTLAIQSNVSVAVFDAIPPVISSVVFGHKKKYTSLVEVSDMFRAELGSQATDARTINKAISRIVQIDLTMPNQGYRLMGVDDKGIVDFVEIAFRLFGLDVNNAIYLYFLALFVCCCCFALSFYKYPACLLLLAAFLIGFYLILPTVIFNAQLNSILSFRAMPILAMVACLHCILYAVIVPQGRYQVMLLVMQIMVLIFVVHMRTTAMWQVLTIAAISVLAFTYQVFGKAHGHVPSSVLRKKAFFSLLPFVLVTIAYGGLQFYRGWSFPEEYQRGEQIMTRTIWHNVFSGLAFHPKFRERYQLRIDDNSVIQAAGEYLVEQGREREWEAVGQGTPNFSVTRWAAYDKVVKEMLLNRCATYVSECLSTIFYYKPLALMRALAWIYGLRASPPDLDIFVSHYWGDAVKQQMSDLGLELGKRNLRALLWTPAALLLLLPFAILMLGEERRSRCAAFVAVVVLSAGSTLPAIIGYPALFTVADTAIAFLMLIYFLFFSAIAVLLGFALERVRKLSTKTIEVLQR